MESNDVKARDQIDPRYQWDPTSVYPSDSAWEAEVEAIEADLEGLKDYRGRLKEAAVLADALEARDALAQRVGRTSVYAGMRHNVETTDQRASGMTSRADTLAAASRAAASFIVPEILQLGQAQVEAWAASEARLEVYRHFFEDLFRRAAHIRSAEVEEVLGLASDPFEGPRSVYGVLTDADMIYAPAVDSQGVEHELTSGTWVRMMRHPDRTLRQTAMDHYQQAHLDLKNTLTNTLQTSIKADVFRMRARRHNSTLEMALFQNNIPVEVFHNLLAVFKANLGTWHRYWRLRRKALGVDELHSYDLWAPLTSAHDKLPYEEAVDMICDGLAPMGEDYVGILHQGCLQDRWVDVFPNRGKRAGAFSWGDQGTHPFIVMSWSDSILSLSTLAHELGHSLHSFLTWKTQPYVYADYSIFVAEVASNFHQAMVRDHLLRRDGDPSFKIQVLEEAMSNFLRYFFIMPTLARFELEIHQRVERGLGLTADDLIELMADLFEEGYGGEVAIHRQHEGMRWATFGHLYSDYYVFQYATGISAAHALSAPILAGEAGAVERYLAFLRAGGSLYPLDALKLAGVDLTTPKAVETTFGLLSDRINQLSELLGLQP